jgi:hypothetical protein
MELKKKLFDINNLNVEQRELYLTINSKRKLYQLCVSLGYFLMDYNEKGCTIDLLTGIIVGKYYIPLKKSLSYQPTNKSKKYISLLLKKYIPEDLDNTQKAPCPNFIKNTPNKPFLQALLSKYVDKIHLTANPLEFPTYSEIVLFFNSKESYFNRYAEIIHIFERMGIKTDSGNSMFELVKQLEYFVIVTRKKMIDNLESIIAKYN